MDREERASLHELRAFDEVWASAIDLPVRDIAQMLHRKLALEHCGPAAQAFEREQVERRLAVWEVLDVHLIGGADSWSDLEAVLTDDDATDLEAICDGWSVEEVMADPPVESEEDPAGTSE